MRARSRLAAVICAAALSGSLALPEPARANPFLLFGGAMISAAETVLLLGTYIVVANVNEPDPIRGPSPSKIACEQEADGTTVCWPASQADPAAAPPAPSRPVDATPARPAEGP